MMFASFPAFRASGHDIFEILAILARSCPVASIKGSQANVFDLPAPLPTANISPKAFVQFSPFFRFATQLLRN